MILSYDTHKNKKRKKEIFQSFRSTNLHLALLLEEFLGHLTLLAKKRAPFSQ